MGQAARPGQAGGASKARARSMRFPGSSKSGRFFVAADPLAGRFLISAFQRIEHDSGFVAFLLGRARPRT
jgi:hypothetical protein